MGTPSTSFSPQQRAMAGMDAPAAKTRAKRFSGRATALKRRRTASVIAVTGGCVCVVPVRTGGN